MPRSLMSIIQVFSTSTALGSAAICADSSSEVKDSTCFETEDFIALQMQAKVGGAVRSGLNHRQRTAQKGAFGDLYGNLFSHLDELKAALNAKTPAEQLQTLNRTLAGVSELFAGMNVQATGAVGNASLAVTSLISLIETSIGALTLAMKWVDSESANQVSEWSVNLKTGLERVSSKVTGFPDQVRLLQNSFKVKVDAALARIQELLPAAPSTNDSPVLLDAAEIRSRGIWDWLKGKLGFGEDGNGDIQDKLETLIRDLNTTVPGVLRYVKTTADELWQNFETTVTSSIAAVKLVVPQSTAIQIEAVVKPVVQTLRNTVDTAMLQLRDAFSEIDDKVSVLAGLVHSAASASPVRG